MNSYDPLTNRYIVDSALTGPLNVGLQLTRRCNLKCIYCSETSKMPDPTLSQIQYALNNLKDAGVLKINLTGGEPLLRTDLKEIVDYALSLGFHVAIDSNSTLVTEELAEYLRGKLSYFESTIDGRPAQHDRVRGHYEAVKKGINILVEHKIPVYIAMVVLGDALEDAGAVLREAHNIGARQVKYIMPIPKAKGKALPKYYLDNPYIENIWESLCEYKRENHLSPTISLADWKRIGNGSVILVNADGEVVGSPTYGRPDCLTHLGNLYKESVREIWKNYEYKENHIKKYSQETMRIS